MMIALESIVRDLETLPVPKLAEVARYVSRLKPPARRRQLAVLRATAGSLSGADGAEFERNVREEAGRIDYHEWA